VAGYLWMSLVLVSFSLLRQMFRHDRVKQSPDPIYSTFFKNNFPFGATKCRHYTRKSHKVIFLHPVAL
jgi:hypothetical protein